MTEAADYCEALVREADKDRYLATLFAPADKRPALHALYAFAIEIARVRELVSDPLPGEIRLQWWREVIEGARATEAQGHPTACALIDAITTYRLPTKALIDLIEARIFDLYDDPMPNVHDLEGYAGETSSSIIQLAAIILADGRDPGTADIAGHGGVALAIAGLLRAFPLHASRGQLYVPVEVLDRHGARMEDVFAGRATPELLAALGEMRALAMAHVEAMGARVAELPAEVVPAFLPVAIVRHAIARMGRPGYDPFTTIVQVPQWQRQWIMWRAWRRAVRVSRGLHVARPPTPRGSPAE